MTKLRIDLQSGILEIEGEEGFVREIYQDYKKKIIEKDFSQIKKPIMSNNLIEDSIIDNRPIKNNKTGGKKKEFYQIVKDLDLSAKEDKVALKSFYSSKSPKTVMERHAVFVYYLQKIAKIRNIDENHIYTCYKNVNEKVPGALRQSLYNTSSAKGWIDAKSAAGISITTQGENFVEFELQAHKGK